MHNILLKKVLFPVILLLSFLPAVWAEVEHEMAILPGVFVSINKEEITSPLTHAAITFGGQIEYRVNTGLLLHKVEAQFSFGENRNNTTGYETLYNMELNTEGQPEFEPIIRKKNVFHIDLGYSLGWNINLTDSLTLTPGASMRFNFNAQLSDFPIFRSSLSAGPALLGSWKITPDDELRFGTQVPLLNYSVSPPYTGTSVEIMQNALSDPITLFTSGSVKPLWEFGIIQLETTYKRKFTDLISASITMESFMLWDETPVLKRDVQTNITTGVILCF